MAVPGTLNIVSPTMKEKTQAGKVIYVSKPQSHLRCWGAGFESCLWDPKVCAVWCSDKAHGLFWVSLCLCLLVGRMGIPSTGLPWGLYDMMLRVE